MIKVSIEKETGASWQQLEPRTVLTAGDVIRFRFECNFSGFLYVLNRGASGEYLWLFPSSETGFDNTVEPNRRYLIPATGDAFVIPPTAGFDTVYWLVSPTRLPDLPALPSSHPRTSKNELLPRCQPGPLRARGLCVDSSAGARAPSDSPPFLASEPGTWARIIIGERDKSHSITAAGVGPVIYEFRIAHR